MRWVHFIDTSMANMHTLQTRPGLPTWLPRLACWLAPRGWSALVILCPTAPVYQAYAVAAAVEAIFANLLLAICWTYSPQAKPAVAVGPLCAWYHALALAAGLWGVASTALCSDICCNISCQLPAADSNSTGMVQGGKQGKTCGVDRISTYVHM